MEKQETLTDETLLEIANHWDIDQWNSECKNLSEKQLAVISCITKPSSGDSIWKEKLLLLFSLLSSQPGIDAFALALDSFQLKEIIYFVSHSSFSIANRQKLSSLFAGIPSHTFKDLLTQVSDEELCFLREEAITEAIQHNLSLLLNELNGRFVQFCEILSTKEKELENLELSQFNSKDISNLHETIKKFYEEGKSIFDLTNKSLAIAWNTQRTDLIQELGRLKELCQKYLIETFDDSKDSSLPTLGIREILKKKTEELFSDRDTNGVAIPMKDSTPALEALIKFSVWNIQDYYDIGLIDSIKLSKDFNNSAQIENLQKRNDLFIEADTNLKKIGLKTLADLKSAKIYSKKALIEYISAHI